ncbi:Peroxidase 73 [Hibiscus syriacus]|uniref:peroxidase n=1 Tax=Hibiscus syriacus TaxID=106335 RepID=A0A6A2WCS6_HIBSY|nr:Peroxidase 73 [Hibiscus syriacus]
MARFINGCDASVIIQYTGGNTAEKDHPDNLLLAGDGFDTVIKAKQAVDAVPGCRNKVSCADILAMVTRDVIALLALVYNDYIKTIMLTLFNTIPMCKQRRILSLQQVSNKIYNFSRQNPVDPTLNRAYVTQLQQMCPRNVDPRIAINMNPNTPRTFDNVYFQNLQQGKGLFTSDQVLFTDQRSKPLVNTWATNSNAFNNAFITAITKLGRVGVKTGRNGNIRTRCDAFN